MFKLKSPKNLPIHHLPGIDTGMDFYPASVAGFEGDQDPVT